MAEITVLGQEVALKDNQIIDSIWHLTEAVSLKQAAALIAGFDPAEIVSITEDDDIYQKFPKYYPAITALIHAVKSKSLAAEIEWIQEYDEEDYHPSAMMVNTDELNLENTIVEVDDLKQWLSDRGFRTGFFFPSSMPDYLDPANDHYSPKLAASISVWEAVTSDTALIRGTSAKQAMMKWLRRNADKYGLTKDDGNPNEQGIEEIAKIANWDAKGGAPKTPG